VHPVGSYCKGNVHGLGNLALKRCRILMIVARHQ